MGQSAELDPKIVPVYRELLDSPNFVSPVTFLFLGCFARQQLRLQ
jgi:hypothetical protein